MFQFDTHQKKWWKNKCTIDIIIVYLKIFKFKKHHKILHTSKCRKKFKIQKKIHVFEPRIFYWKMGRPFSYSSRPQKACMVLCGHPRPFIGPLWLYTPILGGFNLYWSPFWAYRGVNKSWRLYMGRQFLLTPFFWVSNVIHAFLGRGCVSLASPKRNERMIGRGKG